MTRKKAVKVLQKKKNTKAIQRFTQKQTQGWVRTNNIGNANECPDLWAPKVSIPVKVFGPRVRQVNPEQSRRPIDVHYLTMSLAISSNTGTYEAL